VVIRLGQPAKIGRIELDFSHFVNNNPREVAIDGLCGTEWVPLVALTEVKAFAGNIIAFQVGGVGPCEQIRVIVFPDGGMNRVRVFAAP
jgi:allantoicase